MIICTRCNTLKSADDYYRSCIHKEGTSGICKECYLLTVKIYAQKNPEKRRALKLSAKYKMTNDQYYELFAGQGGICAICSKETENHLFVDHCHTTGVIRGLLCHQCNTLLGHAKDDINILCEAIKYLLKKGP